MALRTLTQIAGTCRYLAICLVAWSILAVGGPSGASAQSQPAEKPRVAVLPLETRDSPEEAESIAEQLRAAFVNSGAYIVIDRTLTGQILKEWSTQQSGLTDQEKAVKVGKLYNVQLIVSGKINKFPNEGWQVSAVLLDAQTGVSLRANTVRHRGDFFSLLDEKVPALSQSLVGPVGAVASVAAVSAAPLAVASGPVLLNWAPHSDMPHGRYRHVALAGTTGRIYVFGGRADSDLTSAVDMYNPANDSWSTISSLPTQREWPAGAVAGGRMFVIGGMRGDKALGTVEAYDPSSNAWQTIAPMPTPRWGAVAVSLDERIYVIGGHKSADEIVNTVEVFDTRTGTWASKTPLPRRVVFEGGAAAVSTAIGGAIFVMGGQTPDLGGGLLTKLSNEDTLWIYNPAGNTWIQGKPMPAPRNGPSAVALAGKIYVFGGFVGSSLMRSAAKHYDVYDVASGSWSDTEQMPKPRADFAAVALDGRIFLVGGVGDALKSVDELR